MSDQHFAPTGRLDDYLSFLAGHLAASDYRHALDLLGRALAAYGLDVARTGQPRDEHIRWFPPLAAAVAQAHAAVTPGHADD